MSRVHFGGSARLTLTGYAVSAALFLFAGVLVATLMVIEQIFGEAESHVPREPSAT
jgi:hypothetical protein